MRVSRSAHNVVPCKSLDLEQDGASSRNDVQAYVEVGTGKNNKKFTAAQQDTLNFY